MTNLKNKMGSIANQLSVEELKEQIKIYMDKTEDYAIVVFAALLDALELKIDEAEYIQFCDSL